MASLFRVDPNDPVPLYAQLERAIKLAVASGKLAVGDQLPTVRQLAVDLAINANTVAKVYAELERQGLLATRRGVGTFVQAPLEPPVLSRREKTQELRALADRVLAEAAVHGFTPQELHDEIARLIPQAKETRHGKG